MTKLFTLFIAFLCTLSLSAQNVGQVQMPLISKVTATWCINCGTWGWSFFEDVRSDNEGKALMLGVHFSGDLENPTADSFADNFQAFGQPVFILNNTNQNVNSSNAAAKRQEIKNMVESIQGDSPTANTGILTSLNGNQLDLSIKAKFFEETTGDFYVGVYIVEDGVINNQVGQGSSASHPNVLRTSTTLDWFGTPIDETAINADDEFDFQQSYIIPDNFNSNNLSVVAIIWKASNGIYEYINGSKVDDLNLVVDTQEAFSDLAKVEVAPTLSTNGTTQIQLYLKQSQEAKINLLSASGQYLSQIASGSYLAGTHTFTAIFPKPGMYFIQVNLPEGQQVIPAVAVQ